MPATAARAPSGSTASRSAPASSRSASSHGREVATVEGLADGVRLHPSRRHSSVPAPPSAASARRACSWPPTRCSTAPASDRDAGPGRARRRAVPLHRVPQDRRGGRRAPPSAPDRTAAPPRRRRGRCADRPRGRRGPGHRRDPVRRRRGPGRRAHAACGPLAARPRQVHDRRPGRAARRPSRVSFAS